MRPAEALAARPASLDALVAAAAARCLRAPADTIAPDVPLSLLGLDSLAAVEFAAEIESALGRAVPETLIENCTDLRDVVRRLRDAPPADADPVTRMLADAVLPEDVRPSVPFAGSASLRDSRAILLTGATGFLGVSLASELLRMTDATLYCLARSSGIARAEDRVHDALTAARPRSCQSDRIQAVEGDLSQPQLGLPDAAFAALAGRVDAVCHAAAAVNWVYSYDGLRAANVLGTLELLRLACHDRPLPFHFISSLSVCYSTTGAREVDEHLDPMREIRGLPLGYAQSKAVADALVLEAGRRGLPVRLYRPGLITGDSHTGAFNPDDLLTALVRGCVQMGTAPDLDWQLDGVPVDWAARAIVHLSAATGPVFHLAHPRPRHWRECVLWMRLAGYPLRLVPYHAWLRQLEIDTSASTAHPLRTLSAFFLDRPTGGRGLTLPELYEDGRRVRACREQTDQALGALESPCPPLDAALLDRYFDAFVATGVLAAPEASQRRPDRHAGAWRDRADGLSLTPVSSGDSIIGELTSWRSGCRTGLFHARVTPAPDAAARDAIVKIKARDADAIAVGEALAQLCDPDVGAMYARWGDRLGLTGSHLREPAIYGQRDPRFVRHTPTVLGITSDEATATWSVVLERIDDAVVMDAACRRDLWDERAIGAAIDGLASLQSIWYGRETALAAQPWIGYIPSAAGTREMQGLWSALAAHAAPSFSSWADPGIGAIQRRIIETIPQWWAVLERQPRTLIHNDFNPRNICLRAHGDELRLCAYDWELATLGAPQRDLVELLAFVLPDGAGAGAVAGWIERHRAALARETGTPIEAPAWRAGFGAAVCDMLINRLAIYALIDRVRPQPFLPAVVRTWNRLYELCPLESRA
jgi:thioester reductase-like protein